MKFKCLRWLLTNCSILNAITITHWQFYGRIRICCSQYIKINDAERCSLYVFRDMWRNTHIYLQYSEFGMPISKTQYDLQFSLWFNSPEDYTAKIIHLDTVFRYALPKIEFESSSKTKLGFLLPSNQNQNQCMLWDYGEVLGSQCIINNTICTLYITAQRPREDSIVC